MFCALSPHRRSRAMEKRLAVLGARFESIKKMSSWGSIEPHFALKILSKMLLVRQNPSSLGLLTSFVGSFGSLYAVR